MNDDGVIEVTWTQDLNVRGSQAEYIGYTIDYKEFSSNGNFTELRNISHDVSKKVLSVLLMNGDLHDQSEYLLRVSPYRTWNDEKEYGVSSHIAQFIFSRKHNSI